MVKQLRSDDSQPRDLQFKHFGVLNDGRQSKASMLTSVTANVLLALILFILGAAAKKTITNKKLASISLTPIKPEEPIKPKPLPKPLPKPPAVKLEPPKIKLPDVKLPDLPKPPEIKITAQVPVVLPAAPKLAQPPAAPKIVSLSQPPQAAAIANNAKPAAIRLGQPDNPIKNDTGPAVATVNLGRTGAAGMPATNTGLGPVNVTLQGNGSPSTSSTGNGLRVAQGVKLGPGGNGPLNAPGKVAAPVNLARSVAPIMPQPAAPTAVAKGSPPKVLYKPTPDYTAEAHAKHIEGIIEVRVRVSATGAVQVLGVNDDLGFGLGASAMHATQGMRFQPATDAAGHPIDWEGIVKVAFQLEFAG